MKSGMRLDRAVGKRADALSQKALAMCVRCGYTIYIAYARCVHAEGPGTMATTATRTDRIALRTSKEQKSFLERGASATGQNLTEFVLSSAQEKAEMVLADQNRFVISPKQLDAFVTALDRPATLKENLARLMSEPS